MGNEKILEAAFDELNKIFKNNDEKYTDQEISLEKTNTIKALEIMAKSYYDRSLIIFIGSGCTIEQMYSNWNDYINNFLDFWTYHINNLSEIGSVNQCDMRYIKDLKTRNDIEKKKLSLQSKLKQGAGAIAQSVEQRTENPCVPGSIPGGTT